ncbi:hypothetical protein QTI66_14355 [Variovorax sp. J22R133]|uniref:hypothetical protein n=1 Tax=Variovorax brevis TaxID=3053503 RepID=UPI002576372D|nr:hypothetical protein [Variovorax sp. J22R133]MDM0113336.1 hypothetical protein [Variovorax sp. J22R133]
MKRETAKSALGVTAVICATLLQPASAQQVESLKAMLASGAGRLDDGATMFTDFSLAKAGIAPCQPTANPRVDILQVRSHDDVPFLAKVRVTEGHCASTEGWVLVEKLKGV